MHFSSEFDSRYVLVSGSIFALVYKCCDHQKSGPEVGQYENSFHSFAAIMDWFYQFFCNQRICISAFYNCAKFHENWIKQSKVMAWSVKSGSVFLHFAKNAISQ